jgi:hypothetical protein
MSYDLYLRDKDTKEVCNLPCKQDIKGGTYALGGTDRAELNITYNYGKHWGKAFGEGKHLRDLDAVSGKDSLPILWQAINNLGDDVDEDYWKPTEGNVKAALRNMALLAAQCPDGIWSIN